MKGSPFQRNYGIGSPAKKALVGNQNNLPEELKSKIEASPGKMYDSPAKQATLSTVKDSLQSLPNPAAEKLRKEYEAAQKKLQEDAQKNMDSNTDSTNTANQAAMNKRANQIQKTVSPNEFDEQVKDVNKKSKSPAKQGYRPMRDKDGKKIDYTDPEVLRKEKEGNKRMIESRKKANRDAFTKDPRGVRPSDKYKKPRSKGGAIRSTPKELAERKKNKKAPTKFAPLIAMAGKAIAGKVASKAVDKMM